MSTKGIASATSSLRSAAAYAMYAGQILSERHPSGVQSSALRAITSARSASVVARRSGLPEMYATASTCTGWAAKRSDVTRASIGPAASERASRKKRNVAAPWSMTLVRCAISGVP
jgi:hypothetical protein